MEIKSFLRQSVSTQMYTRYSNKSLTGLLATERLQVATQLISQQRKPKKIEIKYLYISYVTIF